MIIINKFMITPLSYQGSKRNLAQKIISYFPPHSLYVEPFFGSGSIFFSKKPVKYNVLNDLNGDVINFWRVCYEKIDALIGLLEVTPYMLEIFKIYSKSENDVERACAFIGLSNLSLYGCGDTLKFGFFNCKQTTSQKLIEFQKNIFQDINTQFTNCTAIDVISKISIGRQNEIEKTFAYLDPPYFGTEGYDNCPKWTLKNLDELLTAYSKIKFAISEFDTPEVIEVFKKHNLNINIIGERNNIKNRRVEILATNYKTNTTLFD